MTRATAWIVQRRESRKAQVRSDSCALLECNQAASRAPAIARRRYPVLMHTTTRVFYRQSEQPDTENRVCTLLPLVGVQVRGHWLCWLLCALLCSGERSREQPIGNISITAAAGNRQHITEQTCAVRHPHTHVTDAISRTHVPNVWSLHMLQPQPCAAGLMMFQGRCD